MDRVENGCMAVPTGPVLGIEIDGTVLAQKSLSLQPDELSRYFNQISCRVHISGVWVR